MAADRETAFSSVRQWRKRVSSGMDQILPGLFVGGLRDALDAVQLAENKIKAVISVHGFTKDCEFGHKLDVLRVVLNDSPSENVLVHFSQTNSFIHSHRLGQENVLVHCLAGASRSVCFCLAYLMTVTNLSYSTALDYIASRRYCARPNFGFKMQLMKFGQQYLSKERRRLFAEMGLHKRDQFVRLYRSDCLFTNSLFVEGAKEAECEFQRQQQKGTAGQSGHSNGDGKANLLLDALHFIDDE